MKESANHHRSIWALLSTVLICLGMTAATPALAEKRVALVIGVANYSEVPRLTNPGRDADAVAGIFKAAGFDTVRSERDLGVSELRRAVREFSDLARDADIAVVYYAGHGIEVDGTNYLVPADAKLLTDFDIEDETLSLDRVLKAVDPAKRLKLVILDACRDNPFAKTMKRSVATRSVGRGLAKIEPNVANTLIAFAARAGAVASDGDGNNGPFASALVKYITEPGLDLRLAFGRVRDEVLRTTGNRQEPFVYGSLGGETMSLVPAALSKVDPDAAARVDFEFAAQVGSKQGWETFLGKYPKGFYADLARAQRDRLSIAEDGQAKADAARFNAERLAAEKSEEMRKQLEEQSARQTDETRRKISEQAKKELDEARRQVAEQAKRELDEARRQLALAREQAEAARQQVEEAKKQTAAEAARQAAEAAQRKAEAEASERQRLASLTPADAPAAPAAPPAAMRAMDPSDIARLLQVHLKRVGCDPGTSDGNWTDKSKQALDKFNQSARTTFDTKLASLDALDGVRAKTDRVCPLVCGPRQRAEGERCVQISCEKNYVLTSSGVCEKRPEPAPRKEVSARVREPAAPRPAAGGGGGGASRGGGGKCFAFNGKTYCE
jgi:uncharacterized caspase-like protein